MADRVRRHELEWRRRRTIPERGADRVRRGEVTTSSMGQGRPSYIRPPFHAGGFQLPQSLTLAALEESKKRQGRTGQCPRGGFRRVGQPGPFAIADIHHVPSVGSGVQRVQNRHVRVSNQGSSGRSAAEKRPPELRSLHLTINTATPAIIRGFSGEELAQNGLGVESFSTIGGSQRRSLCADVADVQPAIWQSAIWNGYEPTRIFISV